MDEVTESSLRYTAPFNGPVEIGLRALAVLVAAFPNVYSLQRLVAFDYLLVHSDDVPGGPPGLHPKTPRRGGELCVRREVVRKGLLLYQSRGLIQQIYETRGVYYGATERSAGFLDVLETLYVQGLRERADWLITKLGSLSEADLARFIGQHIGSWGTEFATESVLWTTEPA
jgi:hypothetical protein